MVQDVRKLLAARELLLSWTLREFRVRYSQSVLEVAWALVQPLALMAMFTLVFSLFMRVPSQNVPYPVFAYAALLPWTFFVNTLSAAIPSLVNNFNLVSKVAFPREILPLAAILVGLVDFAIAAVVFVLLMLGYQRGVTLMVLWVPIILLVQLALTAGISLYAAALNVFYRDIRFIIPLALQLWLYLTPVIYPMDVVPASLRPLYLLNPMAALIETYRRVTLFGQMPDWGTFGLAALVSLLCLLAGYRFFKHAERRFADVI